MYFVFNYRILSDFKFGNGTLVLETNDKEEAIKTAMEYTFGGREYAVVTDGLDFRKEYH